MSGRLREWARRESQVLKPPHGLGSGLHLEQPPFPIFCGSRKCHFCRRPFLYPPTSLSLLRHLSASPASLPGLRICGGDRQAHCVHTCCTAPTTLEPSVWFVTSLSLESECEAGFGFWVPRQRHQVGRAVIYAPWCKQCAFIQHLLSTRCCFEVVEGTVVWGAPGVAAILTNHGSS